MPRVTIAEIARLTRSSEHTWRNWLDEPNCPLTVVTGPRQGGRKNKPGRVRWLDLDECVALYTARHGRPPELDGRGVAVGVERLAAELEALRAEVRALRAEEHGLPATPAYRAALARVTPASSGAEDGDGTEQPEMDPELRLPLPPHAVALLTFMRWHGARGVQSTSFVNAVKRSHKLVPMPGIYIDRRGNRVNHALDSSGRRRAWELWHRKDWWRDCEACPHDEVGEERGEGLHVLDQMMMRANQRERERVERELA